MCKQRFKVWSFTSLTRESRSACVLVKAMTSAPHCARALAVLRPMPLNGTKYNEQQKINLKTQFIRVTNVIGQF